MKKLKLIWWAICGRLIIHKITFEGGIILSGVNQGILVLNNNFRNKEKE